MKDALREALDAFTESENLYDHRLINAASFVDPPEYLECCVFCGTPDREHATTCPVDKILAFAETL